MKICNKRIGEKFMKKNLGILLLLIMCCSLMVGCGGKESGGNDSSEENTLEKHSDENTIVLNDYVVVDFTGFDGYATAELSVDYGKIARDYKEHFDNVKRELVLDSEYTNHGHCNTRECLELNDCEKCTNCSPGLCECAVRYMAKYYSSGSQDDVVMQIGVYNYELNEPIARVLFDYFPKVYFKDSLKNGMYETTKSKIGNNDILKIEFSNIDLEKLGKILGLEIIASDFSYKVKDLAAPMEIDPFAYYMVNDFKTLNGNEFHSIDLYFELPDSEWTNIRVPSKGITVDCYGKEKDISNGDKIKVSFDDKEGIKKLEEEFGVKLTRTEAEIEVWGKNEYGESSASVPKKSTIDLAEYVTFKVEGEYNGYAYIHPSLNVEKLLLENKDSLSTNVEPEFGLVDSSFHTMKSRLSGLWFDAVNTRTGKLSTSDFTNDQGLKNGDVVKIQPGEFDSWLQNANAQGLFKLFNVELTCSPIEYTVEGLKDVVEVDVFQDFTVEYEGSNGKASIQLIRMNIWVDHYNCLEETAIVNSEKDGTLSNGDILILDISKKHSLMDRLTSCYGVIPTRTQIEVTVEGLD